MNIKNNTSLPISVQNLSISFNKKKVLDNIDVEIKSNEIFGLIGLNGVGKTTFIKSILDLLRPDQGEIMLYGIPHRETKSHKNLSYLPEKLQPSKHLKGKEYLKISLEYYGQKYDHEKASRAAKSLALDPAALDKKVSSYSKGMGQKLGLIATFMSDTPLLILDEPMSGLDPQARILLKDLLLKLKDEGRTIFFSSHILSDIDEICDRIGVINNQKMLFVGTPQEFRKNHNNLSLERAFLDAIK